LQRIPRDTSRAAISDVNITTIKCGTRETGHWAP
jgi:hypothetical protein